MKRLTAIFCLLAMLFAARPVSAGWEQCLRYEENGMVLRECWKQLDSSWYCFDSDGVMRTGWVASGGEWYYCGEGGRMQTGWLTLDDGVWYLSPSGAMAEGKMTVDGRDYTFSADGKVLPADAEDLLSEKFLALSFDSKLEMLEKLFPDGSFWNSLPGESGDPLGVTSVPCVHGTGTKAYRDREQDQPNKMMGKGKSQNGGCGHYSTDQCDLCCAKTVNHLCCVQTCNHGTDGNDHRNDTGPSYRYTQFSVNRRPSRSKQRIGHTHPHKGYVNYDQQNSCHIYSPIAFLLRFFYNYRTI